MRRPENHLTVFYREQKVKVNYAKKMSVQRKKHSNESRQLWPMQNKGEFNQRLTNDFNPKQLELILFERNQCKRESSRQDEDFILTKAG